MKIAACVFAIISGISGLFIQAFRKLYATAIPDAAKQADNGTLIFILNWAIIILGVVSLRFPKFSGICLIIASIVIFATGNYFSAPFALAAGIFDLCEKSRNKGAKANAENAVLLDQLSKLHSLKEKGALSEDVYEQEKESILSKIRGNSLK